jgi:hypothetical protein
MHSLYLRGDISHKSIKMKKHFFIVLLFPLVGFSQNVDMWHFSAPFDEKNIYEVTEKITVRESNVKSC